MRHWLGFYLLAILVCAISCEMPLPTLFGPQAARLDADAGPDMLVPPRNSILLTATVTGGSAPYTYRWTIEAQPDGADVQMPEDSSSESLLLGTLPELGRYVFRLRVTDAGGETDNSYVAVQVGGELAISVIEPDPLTMLGEPVQLGVSIDSDTTGLANRSIEWQVFGDAEIDDPTIANPTVTVVSLNTVQLRVTVSGEQDGIDLVGAEDVFLVGVDTVTPRVDIDIAGVVNGNIVVELFIEAAPITCANFLRYADSGFYDGILFHRAVEDFVIQAGAYERVDGVLTPREGVREAIESEAGNGLSNVRPRLSMALQGTDADSATSQFFINLIDNSHLDEGPPPFTVFGHVVAGIELVDQIASLDVDTEEGFLDESLVPFENVPVDDVIMQGFTRVPITAPPDDQQPDDTDTNGDSEPPADDGDKPANDVEVTVRAESSEPIQVIDNTVELTATLDNGVDPGGFTFTWTVQSGAASLADPNSANTTATIESNNTIQFTVTVRNADDNTIRATAEVIVVGIDEVTPEVVIENEGGMEGDIVISLLVEAAPETCANFLRYVDEGYYDGLVWHRVVPEFVIQGGGFERQDDSLVQREGLRDPVRSEADNGLSNVRGRVAMALFGQDENSATSQFFVNLVDNPGLDSGPPPFTVFAFVVDGMDLVDEIASVEVGNDPSGLRDVPTNDIIMKQVRRRADPIVSDDQSAFAATSSPDVTPRFFHKATLLSTGLAMVTGGMGASIAPPSLVSLSTVSFYEPLNGGFTDQYDAPDGSGSKVVELADARSSHTQTTLLDGRVLITGGDINATGTDPGMPTDTVEIFDHQTGVMSAGPTMAARRSMHTATLLPDGRVVVAGGASWEMFMPAENSWSDVFALSHSRVAHAAVLLEGYRGVEGEIRVLLIGGAGSGPDTMELLNPDDGSSTLMDSTLDVGVDDLAAALLPDGVRVFIVGGQDVGTGDTVPNTYILSSGFDVIIPMDPVPGLPNGIADHQIATFDEFVGVFGGEQEIDGEDRELNFFGLYDTNQMSWTEVGTMRFVHDDFASVPLDDNALLLIGGGVPLLGQEVPSDQAEVFTFTPPVK